MQIDPYNYRIEVSKAQAELIILALVATNSGCGEVVEALGSMEECGGGVALSREEFLTIRELQRYLPELF